MVFEYASAQRSLSQVDLDQSERLRSLIEASQALGRIDSLNELLRQLLRMAQDVTHAEASSILLYNPEKDVLEFALALNDVIGDSEAAALKKNFELPLGKGVAGWVGQERKALNVPDAQKDARFSKAADKATGFVTRCLACIPILNKDELLGVVQVLNSKRKNHFDSDDMELLESFGYLAGVALVRSRLMEEKIRQEKFKSQLETAARIQAHFWPKLPEPVRGMHVWGDSRPAAFVGGDLYDVICAPDSTMLSYVADVSGKGLPAALIMAALWTRIRNLAGEHRDLGDLLTELNQSMGPVMGSEMFATIIICRSDPDTGACQLALGGHLPPLWLDREGNPKTPPGLLGVPIGVLPDATYGEGVLTMEPGDSLLFMTDGIFEARAPDGSFLGETRVCEFLRSRVSAPRGQALMEMTRSWRAGTEPNDDTTVLELWRE